MTFIIVTLWVLLIISMLLLAAVILLQEGKGGGLAEAFGGAGAETFGVKAAGANKFTAIVGGAFLLICVLISIFSQMRGNAPLKPDLVLPKSAAPMTPGAPPPSPTNPPENSTKDDGKPKGDGNN